MVVCGHKVNQNKEFDKNIKMLSEVIGKLDAIDYECSECARFGSKEIEQIDKMLFNLIEIRSRIYSSR